MSGGGSESLVRTDLPEMDSAWVQEVLPYGVFTTDRDLRIRTWNRWLVHHSGKSLEEIRGQPLFCVYPGLGEPRESRFRRALAGEVSILSAALHHHLLPFPLPNDPSEWMIQTARIAPAFQDGQVVGTVAVIEDVTQRETQAQILHRQQELDRLLTEALAALLRSKDPEHDLRDIFAQLTPSLGLDAYLCYLVDATGRMLHLSSSSGLSPALRETLAKWPIAEDPLAPRRGGEALVQTRQAHRDALVAGGLVSTNSQPLTVGERLIGMLTFGSYREGALPAADQAVLIRVAQYVAVVLDRCSREKEIIAASKAKDDFLAALSHELRTPLNPVLLLASDGATQAAYPAEAREAFRLIEKNAFLEARLIDDLLDITRIEKGKTTLVQGAVDVHHVLRDALAMVEADIVDNHLQTHVTLNAERHVVQGDAARLQQVFWNLLRNAVKFTPPGGHLYLTSEVDATRRTLVIHIRDTGIGIDAGDVPRIFSAFVQGKHPEGRHRFGGLGLGLAISRKLVELHGGRIDATSSGRNYGSTFSVTLPLNSEGPAEDPPNKSQRGSNRRELTTAAGRAPRILLVEDHEPTRTPLLHLLQSRGCVVSAVATVTEALDRANSQTFDLVVSDIGLPDGDGATLMASLRDQYNLKGIALTGYGMEEDVARTRRAGFVAHLTKPISVDSLHAALVNALA